MADVITPVSRREWAKAERRRRIVEAATALLRENGPEGVSMILIAERARVSPATVYNLFASKAAVLQQVFDLDLEHYERLVDAAKADGAVERLFKSVEIAADLYDGDPGFYRAMTLQVRRGDGVSISKPRIGFFRRMVAEAKVEGELSAEVNEFVLAVTLSQIMRGALYEWSVGGIGVERLKDEVSYGFALALAVHATDAAAPRLFQRLRRLETRLAALNRYRDVG